MEGILEAASGFEPRNIIDIITNIPYHDKLWTNLLSIASQKLIKWQSFKPEKNDLNFYQIIFISHSAASGDCFCDYEK